MTDPDVPTDDAWFSGDAATFGDRLAAAREALGMDQRMLASKIGVKLATLQRWEEDQSEPRANRLITLAGVLNVPMPWLLTGEGDGGLDGPTDAEVLPADLQGLMAEIRVLQSTLTRVARRLGQVEKRLKSALQETRG